MAKLTLHTYWRSSSAYRVRIALAYKKLPWEPAPVNLLKAEQRSEAYVARSPMGYVPRLDIDGKSFVESVAILELLEELYPEPPLLPKAPEDRAHVRALVQIINAGTQPLGNLNVVEHLSSDKEVRLAWLRHFITKGLGAFEALAAQRDAEGPFAFGAFTMADVYLVPQVYNARRYGVDLAPFPIVARAAAAAEALPCVIESLPEAQPDRTE